MVVAYETTTHYCALLVSEYSGRPISNTLLYIESVDYNYVGMSEILHRRNTLQRRKYLALSTLSRILNNTTVFYIYHIFNLMSA